MTRDQFPMDYLIGATAFGIGTEDAARPVVEYGRRKGVRVDARRSVAETRPMGINCSFPRATKGRKKLQAVGTARILSVRYTSSYPYSKPNPTRVDASQSTVSGVQVIQDVALSEWTEMLNSRGLLFSPVISDETRTLFVLDDGLRESTDLDLVGVSFNAASRQVENISRKRASVRAAWTEGGVRIALLDEKDDVVLAHSISPAINVSLTTAMSIVADLAFVSWMTSEAMALVPDILRTKIAVVDAFTEYLDLDDLYEAHRRSDHIEATERLLNAFGSENHWTRLGTRIVMASLGQKWDS